MQDVDGRWRSNLGGVSIVGDKLQFGTTVGKQRHAIRRGFRGSKCIFECDAPLDGGIVVHYQDVENFMLNRLDETSPDSVTRTLAKFENGLETTEYTGRAFSMSDGDSVRVVIRLASGGNRYYVP